MNTNSNFYLIAIALKQVRPFLSLARAQINWETYANIISFGIVGSNLYSITTVIGSVTFNVQFIV